MAERGREGRACGVMGSGQAVARLSKLPCSPQKDCLIEGGDEGLMHFLKNRSEDSESTVEGVEVSWGE